MPKILQTISTLHILVAFYITVMRIGLILLFLAHCLHFSDTLIEQSENAKIF